MRTRTSFLARNMERQTSNGISSMLINGRENQRRENSMKILDSMLKDHSTLFQCFQEEDTSKELIQPHHKRLLSNNQTATRVKFGGSTKRH